MMLRRNTSRTLSIAPLFFLLVSFSAFAEQEVRSQVQAKTEVLKLHSWSDLVLAGDQQLVVLLVEQTDCGYCKTVKNDYLRPFARSEKHQANVLFSSLLIDGGGTVLDYLGEPVSAKKFAYRYNARFVPTVLFLDRQGREVHRPLIGLGNQDYYGYYLEQAISQSLAKTDD